MIAPKIPKEKYLLQKMKVSSVLFSVMKDSPTNIGYISTKLIYDLINEENFDIFSEEIWYKNIIVPKLKKLHPVATKEGFMHLSRDIRIILDSNSFASMKDLKSFIDVQ